MSIKLSSNKVPDFTITNLPTSIDEGQTISPVISIDNHHINVTKHTSLTFRAYWELSGVGIASTDFENVSVDGNPDPGTTLTGYVNIIGSTASKQFSIGIRSDTHTDDPNGAIVDASENATLSIYRDSDRSILVDSRTFAINDTSLSEPEYEVLLVGGGAYGGYTSNTYQDHGAAGGGGAGGVRHLSAQTLFGTGPGQYTDIYFEIASGVTYNNIGATKMYAGTNNTGTVISYVNGGGAGGRNDGRYIQDINGNDLSIKDGDDAPTDGGSGGGGNFRYISLANGEHPLGGAGAAYGNDGGKVWNTGGGGGGGGAGGAASTRTSSYSDGGPTSADGGEGYDLTNFFSELSTEGPNGDGKIAGGGGGGKSVPWHGSHGSIGTQFYGYGKAGGGNGGDGGDGSDAAANSGSGGGGAGGTRGADGGSGGSGIVYLKYSSKVQLLEWTGTASDHIVTSYDVTTSNGINRVWIHKILDDGYLSLI